MPVLRSVSQPLPYTSSPLLLAAQDLWLFLRITFVWPLGQGIPSIVVPFLPFKSGPLDELYPSIQNLWAILIHLILIVTQAVFLLSLIPSLFFGIPVPLLGWTPTSILIVVSFVVGNSYFCVLLNGTKRRFESVRDPSWQDTWAKHDDERWIFINGVAAGSHWMQSNLDRLALTFRRPIHGIHNKTRGILFDTIECIIQRTFGYATPDIREVYADVLKCVEEEESKSTRYKKIVLILHSQGAIEGGLVLDWLFAAVSQELLERLEVYTFGSAANHFNSPEHRNGQRIIRYIEHYANLGDYVSNFGILHFRPLPKPGRGAYKDREAREAIENRYVGRLFVRKGSGHQMNGNYLDNFFDMTKDPQGRLVEVEKENDYMSAELNDQLLKDYDIAGKVLEKDVWEFPPEDTSSEEAEPTKKPIKKTKDDASKRPKAKSREDSYRKSTSRTKDGLKSKAPRKVKDVSRLWRYRNGMSPDD